MKELYIEFKTWKEGSVEIPWEFIRIKGDNDYRSRKNLKQTVDDSFLRNIFLSFNESKIDEFLSQYIAADILGLVCVVKDLQDAVDQLEHYFDMIEVIGYIELDDSNRSLIIEKMGNTVS